MKFNTVFIGFMFVVVSMFFSCSLGECTNKSTYLDSFEKFVNEVGQKSQKFSENDWKKAEEKFKKYTGECYDKFKDELTLKEEGRVTKYSLKYTFYKLRSEWSLSFTDEKMESMYSDFEDFFGSGKEFRDSLSLYLQSDEFKTSIEEFREGMEQLGKGLDNLAKGLKQIFGEKENEKE